MLLNINFSMKDWLMGSDFTEEITKETFKRFGNKKCLKYINEDRLR